MALKNLQFSVPLHGATVPHVRHLFEICYKLTCSIKTSTMLFIVEILCDCVIQLLLAHPHLRSEPLFKDSESGYVTIALDVVNR